ncbi:MAG: hypothetical protein D3908_01805, partial [Candidatus Electrothrix sp. AUS4]|nr:hypothetical protein [Candidatus Electrothrix sp. AUS4]
NDGGNDDIYFSHYQDSKWTDPQILHAANEVPDIKPEIQYNDEGNIEASWIGYRGERYVKLFSVYSEKTGWSAEQEKLETEEEELQEQEEPEIELPSFLPSDSQYFLKVY